MQAVLAQYYFKYVAKYRQLAIVLHNSTLTGTTSDTLPIPNPVMKRPANNNGLNKGPVIPFVINISNQPMVNGKLHRTIVNWRPLLSTNHPAKGAPRRLPTADNP